MSTINNDIHYEILQMSMNLPIDPVISIDFELLKAATQKPNF